MNVLFKSANKWNESMSKREHWTGFSMLAAMGVGRQADGMNGGGIEGDNFVLVGRFVFTLWKIIT